MAHEASLSVTRWGMQECQGFRGLADLLGEIDDCGDQVGTVDQL